MINQDKHDHDTQDRDHRPGRATVAVFRSRAEAREAVAALHERHYTHTWLGVTSVAENDVGEETLTVESGTGGFFSSTQSLVDALVSHGVHGEAARAVESSIEPGDVLLTLDPKDKDLGEALALIEAHGGRAGDRPATSPRPAFSAGRVPAAATPQLDTAIENGYEEETFFRRGAFPR